MTADAERIGRRYDERSAAWTTASHVLSNVENSLKDRPGTLADYNGEVPKLNKGEMSCGCARAHPKEWKRDEG